MSEGLNVSVFSVKSNNISYQDNKILNSSIQRLCRRQILESFFFDRGLHILPICPIVQKAPKAMSYIFNESK
jgi:hypothetical protein